MCLDYDETSIGTEGSPLTAALTIDQVVIMSEVEILGLKTVYNTLLCVKCLLEYFLVIRFVLKPSTGFLHLFLILILFFINMLH